MDGVLEAVDQVKVPGATQAEFGKREFPKDTKAELDALEAQVNAQLLGQPQPTSVYEPSGQPAPAAPVPAPAPAPAPTIVPPPAEPQPVPPKFANPDGSLNQQKLEKSYVNLEAYLQKERELTQLRQQPQYQQQPQQYQPQPPQYQPPQPQYQPQPIEQQVNEGMRSDPGMTALNLARAAALQAQAYSDAQNLELKRKLELMELRQQDPGAFTSEGHERLSQTLKENPWLWNSPTPWLNAYKMTGPIAPRNAPTAQAGPAPVASRPSAPILPGGQAPASIPQGTPAVSSEADLRRALEQRFPNNPMAQVQALEDIFNRNVRRG